MNLPPALLGCHFDATYSRLHLLHSLHLLRSPVAFKGDGGGFSGGGANSDWEDRSINDANGSSAGSSYSDSSPDTSVGSDTGSSVGGDIGGGGE